MRLDRVKADITRCDESTDWEGQQLLTKTNPPVRQSEDPLQAAYSFRWSALTQTGFAVPITAAHAPGYSRSQAASKVRTAYRTLPDQKRQCSRLLHLVLSFVVCRLARIFRIW